MSLMTLMSILPENHFKLVLKRSLSGMSRLALITNVQWSAEGATNCIYSVVQNHMNVSRPRSGNFDEKLER